MASQKPPKWLLMAPISGSSFHPPPQVPNQDLPCSPARSTLDAEWRALAHISPKRSRSAPRGLSMGNPKRVFRARVGAPPHVMSRKVTENGTLDYAIVGMISLSLVLVFLGTGCFPAPTSALLSAATALGVIFSSESWAWETPLAREFCGKPGCCPWDAEGCWNCFYFTSAEQSNCRREEVLGLGRAGRHPVRVDITE